MKKIGVIRSLVFAAALMLAVLCTLSSCGESDEPAKLVYTLNQDGAGYTVSAEGDIFGEEVIIPDTYQGLPVTEIANRAFVGCKGFRYVEIPTSVKKIGYDAFKECRTVEIVFLGEGVEIIGSGAFSDCDALKRIEIPEGVSVIESRLFYGCDSLKTVKLGDGVKQISYGAFGHCGALLEIEIPEGVTAIGDSAFSYCTSLVSVGFSDGSLLERIGNQSFYSCSSLEQMRFPIHLQEIGGSAFRECRKLKMVYFTGSELKKIGTSAFKSCPSLCGVDITDIGNWCGVDFVSDVYSNPIYTAEKVYNNGQLVLRLEIPNGVESISARAFQNATRIVSVTLPPSFGWDDSVIGKDAFRYCYKLVEVFNYSTLQVSNESADIEKFGYIGAYVQKVHNWQSEDLYPYPEDEKIFPYGEAGRVYPQSDYGQYLTNVYTYGENDEFVFFKDGTLHYLLEYIGTKKNVALPTTEERYGIYAGAFFGHAGIESIYVPKSVKEIWHFAFYNCPDLKKIYISDSVTSFGERMFGNCDGLVIYLEEQKLNLIGWKENWADSTDKERITILHGQKEEELEWLVDLIG